MIRRIPAGIKPFSFAGLLLLFSLAFTFWNVSSAHLPQQGKLVLYWLTVDYNRLAAPVGVLLCCVVAVGGSFIVGRQFWRTEINLRAKSSAGLVTVPGWG